MKLGVIPLCEKAVTTDPVWVEQCVRLLEDSGVESVWMPEHVIMAEDYEPVSVAGDRSLTRYRAMAAKQLAAACPLPGAPVPDEELQATLQDWLDEFERVQLLLRLSGRLRQLHGD